MEKREARPGAMKLPAGAKDRERIEALERKVGELEKIVNSIAPLLVEGKTGRKAKG